MLGSLPHKIKNAFLIISVVRLSSLQKAIIIELTGNQQRQYEIDSTTETVFQLEPLIDVVVEAHAGPDKDLRIGKTLVFLIPVVVYLLTDRNKCPRLPRTIPTESTDAYAKPWVFVLKTREPAAKANDIALDLTRSTNVILRVIHGGTPFLEQMLKLQKGRDLLCATLGRLLDYVEKRKTVRGIPVLSLLDVPIV